MPYRQENTNDMKIQMNSVVAFHYTLKNISGTELDSSRGGLPLLYLHGHGHIVRGLERALEGRERGDVFEVVIEPEDAYGVHDPELVQQVPRHAIETAAEIALGMQFQAHTEDGPVPVTVVAMDDETIIVDGNHALAGEQLHFSVEIRHVRAASEQERLEGVADAD